MRLIIYEVITILEVNGPKIFCEQWLIIRLKTRALNNIFKYSRVFMWMMSISEFWQKFLNVKWFTKFSYTKRFYWILLKVNYFTESFKISQNSSNKRPSCFNMNSHQRKLMITKSYHFKLWHKISIKKAFRLARN